MACSKGGKGNTPPPNFNSGLPNAPGDPNAPGGANTPNPYGVGALPSAPKNSNVGATLKDSGTPNNLAINGYEVQQYSERETGININMTNPESTVVMDGVIIYSVGTDPIAPALVLDGGNIAANGLNIFTSDKFFDDGSGELANMKLDTSTNKTGYSIVSNVTNIQTISLANTYLQGTIQMNGSAGLTLIDALLTSGVNLPVIENNSGVFITLINCIIDCQNHDGFWIKGSGFLILHNCTFVNSATKIDPNITIIEPTSDLEDKYGKVREYQTPELKQLSQLLLNDTASISQTNSSTIDGIDSIMKKVGKWVGYSDNNVDIMEYKVNWFADQGNAPLAQDIYLQNGFLADFEVFNNSSGKLVGRLELSLDNGISWIEYARTEVFAGSSSFNQGNFIFDFSGIPGGTQVAPTASTSPQWRMTYIIEQNGAVPLSINYVTVKVSNLSMLYVDTSQVFANNTPYSGFKYDSNKNDKHVTQLPEGSHSIDDESLEIIQVAPVIGDSQYILPDATLRKGRALSFRNQGNFGVNIQGFSGQNLSGKPNHYLEVGIKIDLISDGGNWLIDSIAPLNGVVTTYDLSDLDDYRDQIVHFWQASSASSIGLGTLDSAIDNDVTSSWRALTNTNEYYGIQFNTPRQIRSILFNSWLDGGNYSGVQNFNITASNTGLFTGEEVSLFTGFRDNFNGNEFYVLANNTEYLFYRINILDSYGANIGISTVNMFYSVENPEGALLGISGDFNRISLKKLALQDLSDIQPYVGNGNKELVVSNAANQMLYKYEGAKNIRTIVTNNADIFNNESVVLLDATLGNFTCWLADPNIIDNRGKVLTFKKIDGTANTFTVNADFTTIDGVQTKVLTTQFETFTIIGVGSQWLII